MRNLYLGDIHGNFNLIKYYITTYDIRDANLIQLGDFGVGFKPFHYENEALKFINEKLVENNIFLYAVRGNHDFKPYFDKDPFELSNIKLVPDYTVLNLGGLNHLFLGGAVSVDRMYRYTQNQLNGNFIDKTGKESWWEDELFVLDIDKLNDMRDIDVVVTHTCPDYCTPDNSNGFGYFVDDIIKSTGDEKLKSDLLNERRCVTEAFFHLKKNNDIKLHLYGHYHKSDVTNFNDIEHRLLNIGELWEKRAERDMGEYG